MIKNMATEHTWPRLWKMQGRGSTKNTEALTRKHERSEIKHTQKGRCLKTHGKAVEGLIFKQGDTQGYSWSECLGEVRKRLSTPGACPTLSPCLSICLRTFPFQSQNSPPAQKPREGMTMPWKSFNQTGSPPLPQRPGIWGMGKKGQEVTHIELPVCSAYTGVLFNLLASQSFLNEL